MVNFVVILRSTRDADQATVEGEALRQANVARFVDGKEIVKKIYVPGKILNLVVK